MVVLKNSRAVSGITLYTCPFTETGDAAATALARAERGLEIHLVMQAIFLNHLLKRLNHVVRAFQMAGTSEYKR